MKDLLDAISTFGFPIVLSAYLLFRQEKKMDDLVESIKGRDGILDKINELLEKIKGK